MNAAVLPINPNESELILHVKSQESFNTFHTENNISLFFFVILVRYYFPAWWIILLHNRKHKPYILYMYLFSPPRIKCVVFLPDGAGGHFFWDRLLWLLRCEGEPLPETFGNLTDDGPAVVHLFKLTDTNSSEQQCGKSHASIKNSSDLKHFSSWL